MSADIPSNPPDDFVQELFDIPSRITQVDLVEYLNALGRYSVAKDDLETLGSQLEEMLILESPVEQGRYTVKRRADGRGIEVVDLDQNQSQMA